MKSCGACRQSLPRELFSKKQWQSKKCRRCKNCVANERQVVSEAERDLASFSLGETAANDATQEPRSTNSWMPGRDDGHRAEAWTEEDLFREPPPREDCPICFIRMPLRERETMYQSCCGKVICCGCVWASTKQAAGKRPLCPFCRTPVSLTEEESNKRIMKRAKDNDPGAMRDLGIFYRSGLMGLPRDHGKAMEIWLRAGELGSAASYSRIGAVYGGGEGVEVNMEKAKYYFTLAAIGGCAKARLAIGIIEKEKGDTRRAIKDFMISAGCGDEVSLAEIKELYTLGHATKGDFERALVIRQS